MDEYTKENQELDKKARYRAWVFTKWDNFDFENVKCNYIVVGHEIAPSTGKEHWQGYIEFKDAKTLSAVRKLFNNEKMYLWNRRGTPEQASNYCKKGKDFVEFGKISGQGTRTDLIKIKDLIVEGLKVDDIVMNDPLTYHQYGRTLTKIEDIALRKKFRSWMTTCDWLYGPTGSGKSHKAFEGYSPETHYVLNLNDNGWWDGYTGQETIIINEFRGQIKYSELLDLIDKYPKTVKRRNREPVPFLGRHIVVTSSMKPSEVYHNLEQGDGIGQLLRRINVKKITHYTEVVGGNIVPRPVENDFDESEDEHDES